jgi:hypothetical protein
MPAEGVEPPTPSFIDSPVCIASSSCRTDCSEGFESPAKAGLSAMSWMSATNVARSARRYQAARSRPIEALNPRAWRAVAAAERRSDRRQHVQRTVQ